MAHKFVLHCSGRQDTQGIAGMLTMIWIRGWGGKYFLNNFELRRQQNAPTSFPSSGKCVPLPTNQLILIDKVIGNEKMAH